MTFEMPSLMHMKYACSIPIGKRFGILSRLTTEIRCKMELKQKGPFKSASKNNNLSFVSNTAEKPFYSVSGRGKKIDI